MRRAWLPLTCLLAVAAGGCDVPGTAAAPGDRAADTAEDGPASGRLAPTTHSQRPCPVPSPGIVRYTGVIAETVLDHLGGRERLGERSLAR